MDFRPTTRMVAPPPEEAADPFRCVDPLCQLNLKETSDFVRAFPAPPRCSLESRRGRVAEAPATPGRALAGFYGARKSVPSKWDDAEKWLVGASCRESPAAPLPRLCQQKGDAFAEKRARGGGASFHGPSPEHAAAVQRLSLDVPLKDKFTDNVELVFQCSEPTRESFIFQNTPSYEFVREDDATTEAAVDVKLSSRDVWTETTPLESSATSRCHTPVVKSSSPARHNTPADRSGLLVPPKSSVDVLELSDCHFAKLELGGQQQFDSVVSNWSSREEEEEEVSKSLRHFEMEDAKNNTAVESRASAWEDEEKTKSCIRYQREEAKIQAWVNLQSAKAEAQSRKLEVKIQKMRANLEEKLMKRMSNVHKKAEEWRSAAQLLHSQEVQRASEQAQKMKTQHGFYNSSKCGCFPLNNHI